MTISIAAYAQLSRPYSVASATSNAAATVPTTSAASTDENQTTSVTSSLSPVSISSLPLIKMSPDQLAALQSGDMLRQPDPAKTAAQNATKAFAVVKDASTGQILGGVWPNAGVVSKPNIAIDDRLTGNSNWNEVTEYLAQDIAKGTGSTVTIQYFRPDDPSAPTFGDTV